MSEPISAALFRAIVDKLRMLGFADEDIAWAEACRPPDDAQQFAAEAIFVICNSGMKNTVARKIYDRVMPALFKKRPVIEVFGHKGKAAAIEWLWECRDYAFQGYVEQESDEARLAWCADLPWIGGITKYHLAKTFGVQVAKPDVHLQRLADREGCSAQVLCERLAADVGLKVATVDLILWRACAEGVIDSRSGEVRL